MIQYLTFFSCCNHFTQTNKIIYEHHKIQRKALALYNVRSLFNLQAKHYLDIIWNFRASTIAKK